MKIRQEALAVTVQVRIAECSLKLEDPCVLVSYSGGGIRRISQHRAPADVPQEILDAVRAAVDWSSPCA